MLHLLAATAPSTASPNGAPLEQIAIVAVLTTAVTLLMLGAIARYRAGYARPLRALGRASESVMGIPAWAGVPAVAGVAFGALALFGVTWDVALHIDEGRDEGPLGTAAHYPILIGLLGLFQSGLLAVGMAPKREERASRAALRIRGLWPVPVSAALMLVSSGLAFMGFPLDDLWHRIFGQDVSLWGPTHVMMIACAVLGVIAALVLLVEGARVAGRDLLHRGGVAMRPLPVAFGAVLLLGWAVLLGEFDWGVPQYRMVWHPMLLAFASAQAFVVARIWGGRGAALAAWAIYLPSLGVLSLLVGGPLGQSMPSLPLFLAQAVAVELLAGRGTVSSPVRFGALAGLLAGTVGFAAEYAWSQIAMPIPWTTNLLPEGLPASVVAGVAGGVLGAVFTASLMGTLAPGRGPRVAATLATIAVVGLGVNALAVQTPDDVRATISMSDVRTTPAPGYGGDQPTGRISVRFDPPSVTDGAHWVQAMGWQGRGSFVDPLTEQPDGSWTTDARIPVTGNWKSMVRVHAGRTMLAAPVFMRPDPAIDFAGMPLRPEVTRQMVFDQRVLQIERKDDVPGWLWTPAIILVLGMVLVLAYATGRTAAHVGRAGRPVPAGAVAPGLLGRLADAVHDRLTPRGPGRPLA
ncbi:unannotated protein [freshwater metagenome]|uniref:Unannotated protein n=1 Tax=freshwater metagenome TaxID=449393 RepID=A0A6J7JUL0_9ZZZZ